MMSCKVYNSNLQKAMVYHDFLEMVLIEDKIMLHIYDVLKVGEKYARASNNRMERIMA